MARRIDDQQRVITFVMEGDLSAVESALKTANAIFASRKKQSSTIGNQTSGQTSAAPRPVVTRRRRTTSEPTTINTATLPAEAISLASAAGEEDQLAL